MTVWEFLTATANRLSSLDLALVVFGWLVYKMIVVEAKIKRATVQYGIVALVVMAVGALAVRVLLIIKTGG